MLGLQHDRLPPRHVADAAEVPDPDTRSPVEPLDFDAVTATNINGFLDCLERERGNSAKTRNVRLLTAIRSVLSRALPDHSEHAATITQVLAIPPKRTTRPVIELLTPEEVAALLDAPDPTTWTAGYPR